MEQLLRFEAVAKIQRDFILMPMRIWESNGLRVSILFRALLLTELTMTSCDDCQSAIGIQRLWWEDSLGSREIECSARGWSVAPIPYSIVALQAARSAWLSWIEHPYAERRVVRLGSLPTSKLLISIPTIPALVLASSTPTPSPATWQPPILAQQQPLKRANGEESSLPEVSPTQAATSNGARTLAVPDFGLVVAL